MNPLPAHPRVAGLCAVLIAVLCGESAAAADGFERYQVILTRQPFGAASEEQAVTAPAPAPPPWVASRQFTLCALMESSMGLRVGLLDHRVTPPRDYYLAVGQIVDDVELLDADYEAEAARVRVGGDDAWLHMDGTGTRSRQVQAPFDVANEQPEPEVAPVTIAAKPVALERRVEPRVRLEGDALMSRLSEVQMTLIREKGPDTPRLPIPQIERALQPH